MVTVCFGAGAIVGTPPRMRKGSTVPITCQDSLVAATASIAKGRRGWKSPFGKMKPYDDGQAMSREELAHAGSGTPSDFNPETLITKSP